MAEYLFKDQFEVISLDPDGKKFDKVTRIEAQSENDMYMQLDIASEVYPMCVKEKFNMVLALTLNLDGSTDTGYYTQAGRKTLADDYDYIMHGKLYRISEDSTKDSNGNSSTKVEIYASFGGLLMMLKGDPSTAASFQLDQKLFLLIRKLTGNGMNDFYQNIGPLNLQHLIDESPMAAVASTCLLLDGYKVHMPFTSRPP